MSLGILACLAVVGAVWVTNSYMWPEALAEAYAIEHGIAMPPGGLQIPTGIAIPVLIAIGIAVVMTFLATRRRFGRYVFSIGGNPDAAELAGINTRLTIMKTFIVMGMLAAVSAAVISARLNAATVGLGTQAELQVIAAAVIGGANLAGGAGTAFGALIGAALIEVIRNSLGLLGINAFWQGAFIGGAIILAVLFDRIRNFRQSE